MTKKQQGDYTTFAAIQRIQIAKAIEKEKHIFGFLMLPNFVSYYKATIIKIVWYWHKYGHINKWKTNRKSRNRCTHVWAIDFQQWSSRDPMRENWLSINNLRNI